MKSAFTHWANLEAARDDSWLNLKGVKNKLHKAMDVL